MQKKQAPVHGGKKLSDLVGLINPRVGLRDARSKDLVVLARRQLPPFVQFWCLVASVYEESAPKDRAPKDSQVKRLETGR